jgi:hypothetical protein
MLGEALLPFFLGHFAIGLGQPKKQFGPEKRIADLAADASIVVCIVEKGRRKAWIEIL